jgi:hypothetical protein
MVRILNESNASRQPHRGQRSWIVEPTNLQLHETVSALALTVENLRTNVVDLLTVSQLEKRMGDREDDKRLLVSQRFLQPGNRGESSPQNRLYGRNFPDIVIFTRSPYGRVPIRYSW